jgi:hypothetical protein
MIFEAATFSEFNIDIGLAIVPVGQMVLSGMRNDLPQAFSFAYAVIKIPAAVKQATV